MVRVEDVRLWMLFAVAFSFAGGAAFAYGAPSPAFRGLVLIVAAGLAVAAVHAARSSPVVASSPPPSPPPSPPSPGVVGLHPSPPSAPAVPERMVHLGYPPFSPPVRYEANVPVAPLREIPLSVRGQPLDPAFQRVGTLSDASGTVLPLFGRPTRQADWKWLYYTATDEHMYLTVGVTVNGKDCLDEFGCPELLDGDTAHVPELGRDFTVKLFRVLSHRY